MKRKNLITLLAFFPLFSVWGQSSLNPVEKEKLKLPELPQTMLRATAQANEQVDYTKGTFIVNEDWFGHQNSTVNFLSDDGKWTLRAFQKENPGHELGCTSQFGTIYGDKFYIVSKQEKDPGATVIGSRLAVIDAKTMKVLKEFTRIGDSDGRSFLGVDEHTGYIGTSNGIFLYDIDKMEIGEKITGTENTSGSLYSAQIGTMIRVGDRVFAVHQKDGLLVIDAKTHTLETTILKPEEHEGHGLGSIVLSKDGTIWASPTVELTGTGASLPLIWKVDPTTLTVQQVDIPTTSGIEEIPNSWYAWTADGFCASTKENKIYWKGQGTGSWFTGYKIFCYDIDKNEFYKVFDFGKVEGDWRLYGTGFRIDPVSDDMYCFWYHEFLDPEHELAVVETDGRGEKNGTIKGRYPYDITNYWFPALPVFPDNEAPVIQGEAPKEVVLSAERTQVSIPLEEIVKDADNMTAAITLTTTMSEAHQKLITVAVQNCQLVIQPVEASVTTATTIPVHLKFNSNGKTVETDLTVKLEEGTGAPFVISESEVAVEKGKTVTLTVKGMEGETATWKSEDGAIATVSEDGMVAGKATGTTTITASSKDRDVKATCKVTVKRESLILDMASVELFEGQSQTVMVKGGWLNNKETLKWESSDTSILEITRQNPGQVQFKALKTGSAKIIAKISSKEEESIVLTTTECSVLVKELIPVEKIELTTSEGEQPEEETLKFNINGKKILKAKVFPENASIKDVEWISSNQDAFTIENGIVTAIGDGVAEITVRSIQGQNEVTSNPIKVTCEYQLERIVFSLPVYGYSKSMMNDMGEITPEVKCYPATPKIKTMNIEWNFQVPSDWTNSSLTNPKEEASSDDSSDKNGIRYKITQYPENWETSEPYTFYEGEVPLECTVTYAGKKYTAECIINFQEKDLESSFELENEDKKTLLKSGETLQLKWKLDGEGMSSKLKSDEVSVKFISSDENIASVNKDGLITAKGNGIATITAYVSDGSYSEERQILVGDTWATDVVCKEDTVRVTLGEAVQLAATVNPKNATYPTVEWSKPTTDWTTNSGTTVGAADITDDGIFSTMYRSDMAATVNNIGKYDVKVSSFDGQASGQCVVYVLGLEPLQDLTLTSKGVDDEISIDVKDDIEEGILYTQFFDVGFVPSNATLAKALTTRFTITSQDKEILEISTKKLGDTHEEGFTLKPKKQGTTQIIVSAKENDVKAVKTIRVTDSSYGILGVTLDASVMTVKAGEPLTIGYQVETKQDGVVYDKTVYWESSDPSVATVDRETGLITPIKVGGTTTIRAITKFGNFTATCHLNVAEGDVKVSGVKLDKNALTLAPGENAQLYATIAPADAANKKVTWISENNAVATVAEGLVTGVSAGSTIVRVTTEDGGYTAECVVTVGKKEVPATGISLDKTSVELEKGKAIVLRATVTPANATNKRVIWLSSDEDVIAVDTTGIVEGLEEGEADVIAVTSDGKHEARCSVTVYDPATKPEVIAKDSSAVIVFARVEKAEKYRLQLYRYVGNTPILDKEYVADRFGNIINGLKSSEPAPLASTGKVAVNIAGLRPDTKYSVKIVALDKSGNKISTVTADPFTTAQNPTANEEITSVQPDAFVANNELILENLAGCTCYVVDFSGRITKIYTVKSEHDRTQLQQEAGTYIITAVKDQEMYFSKKVVIR